MEKIKVKDIALLLKEELTKLKAIVSKKQTTKLNLQNRITESVYDQLSDNSSIKATRLMNQCAKPYHINLSPLEIFGILCSDNLLKMVHLYLQGKLNDIQFHRFINSIK